MKASKKLISALLSIMLILTIVPAAALGCDTDTALRFGEDGSFTILQLADIQDGYPLNKATKMLITDTLELVQPDLVVLTGDNIAGASTTTKALTRAAISEFMSIFEKAGVPTAAVFGNHDDESICADKDFQMSVYESFDCFVGCNEGDALPGVGTYNLPVMSSDGERIAFNIWMTDSGTYDNDGYACTTKEQIAWYKETSEALRQANGGEPVPSINFQHIIVPDIYDALEECEKGTPGSVLCKKSYTPYTKGKYYKLPEGATGTLKEAPCPPSYTNGQLDAFIEQGDVLATVSGHDHINSFVIPYKGVDIINTPCVSFSSYNNEDIGSRVFVLDENAPGDYETYMVGYFDVYGDDEDALIRYKAFSDTSNILIKIFYWFKYIFGLIF